MKQQKKQKPLAKITEKYSTSGKWVSCDAHFGIHHERITCKKPRE